MNKKHITRLFMLSVLILGTLSFVLYAGGSARALGRVYSPSLGEVCYAIADGEDSQEQDTLVRVDFDSGSLNVIGRMNTLSVEAMAFQPGTNLLFAADADRLGVVNPATGAFTGRPSTFGSGNGTMGVIPLDDADGISFDATTSEMYGVIRLRDHNAPVDPDDILFKIDPVSGAHVPNAFGPGVDYVVVASIISNFHDIDDMVIDPTTGTMYAIANNGARGDALITIDKSTGAESLIGVLGVDDMEGLTFDPAGQLLGTTGKDSTNGNSNKIFRINKTTGVADQATAKSLVQTASPLFPFDYEAVDCLSILLDTPTPPTPTATASLTPTPTGTPTAVHLLYFQADRVGSSGVTLTWATASEIGTHGFNIYRSTDPDFSNPVLVGFEPARGGSVPTTYTWNDNLPAEGRYWYRLEEMVNAGGKVNSTVIASAPALSRVYMPLLVRR